MAPYAPVQLLPSWDNSPYSQVLDVDDRYPTIEPSDDQYDGPYLSNVLPPLSAATGLVRSTSHRHSWSCHSSDEHQQCCDSGAAADSPQYRQIPYTDGDYVYSPDGYLPSQHSPSDQYFFSDGVQLSGPNPAAFQMDEKDPSLPLLYSRGRPVGSREDSFGPSSRSSSSMSHSHSSLDSDESSSQPPPPQPTSKTSSNQRRGSISKVQCTFSYYEPSRHADAKSLLMKRKPAMACLFCRMRKIACAPPVPPETRCNQCARREITCEYPKESKRGQYRRQQYLERVGKEVAEKIAEVERLAADVERNGGTVTEVQGHVATSRSVGGRNRRLSSASQPY